MIGKPPPGLLEKYVFNRIGKRDPSVLVGPSIGEDAAIIDLGGKVLVAHVDPITGAVELLGRLAVYVASNDVAVRGARPRWLLPVLYLPEDSGEALLDTVTAQIDEAARNLGAMVVGGHTEFTPGIRRPLISMTAIGLSDHSRYVTTGGARPGDVVIMTKTAGIEGTAILATDLGDALRRRGVPEELIRRGGDFVGRVSIVREALALADAGLATSMHDPTEGGILGGLVEMAHASGVEIRAWEERVALAEETDAMVRALGLDPLRIISSGALLATVPGDRAGEALRVLEGLGLRAAVIGEVVAKGKGSVEVHRRDGSVGAIVDPYVRDELIEALGMGLGRKAG